MAVFGTIICLGDSLTHGARDDYGRCYPMELSDMLWEKYGQRWLCAEEGVNGERSSDVLRRALSVIKRYPEAHEVVLLCGTNDSKDRFNTPPDVYKRNVEGILRIAAMHDKEVIICYIPDLNGFGAPDYSQESPKRIESFNEKIEELIREYPNIIKGEVDLRNIPDDYYADGVHFKNKGHVEIARRVYNGLVNKREFKKFTSEYEYPDDEQQIVFSTKHMTVGYYDADGSFRPVKPDPHITKPNTTRPSDPKLTTNFDPMVGKGGL